MTVAGHSRDLGWAGSVTVFFALIKNGLYRDGSVTVYFLL